MRCLPRPWPPSSAGGDHEAHRAALEVPGERRVVGLVEVVDPEDRHVVGAGHHPEVLRVHVAEGEHGGHLGVLAGHVAVEQQAGPAEEGEQRRVRASSNFSSASSLRLAMRVSWSSRTVWRTWRRRSWPLRWRGRKTISPRARASASLRNASTRDPVAAPEVPAPPPGPSSAPAGTASRRRARASTSSLFDIDERPEMAAPRALSIRSLRVRSSRSERPRSTSCSAVGMRAVLPRAGPPE